MRGTGVGVITAFALPPGAPAAVAAAQEEFNRVANKWAELQGDLEDAEAAVKTAQQADTEAVAAAISKGEAVEDAAAREREALVKVRAYGGMLQGAELAADKAGNALLGPIEAAREDWAAQLEAERDEARTRYDEAVEEAQVALVALGKAQSALTWIRNYDAVLARAGEIVSYHGKAEPFVSEDRFGRQEDPRQLLELAATATARLSREEKRAERRAEAVAR